MVGQCVMQAGLLVVGDPSHLVARPIYFVLIAFTIQSFYCCVSASLLISVRKVLIT